MEAQKRQTAGVVDRGLWSAAQGRHDVEKQFFRRYKVAYSSCHL
jgi:hypothetical protein